MLRVIRAAGGWVGENRGLFVGLIVIIATALAPLYTILVPPVIDLGEHILIAKLLWEKLAGVSNLDLELSTFLGYRLLPFLIAAAIAGFERLGVSLVYLPKLILIALISFHSALIMAIMHFTAKERGERISFVYAVIVALPPVAAMYSAAWFIGFINFTLGLSFVVAAICLTEWFLRDGRHTTVALLFTTLLLAYVAHPFAPIFWVAWCACRGVMSMAALNFRAEWKRLLMLPLFFLPIVLYHFLATTGTELEPRSVSTEVSPVVTFEYWQARMSDVWRGIYLQADDNSGGALFAAFFLILVAVTLALTFFWGTRRLRAMMLTCVAFFLTTSVLEERFVPTPSLHWLAYEFRFYTAAGLICLTITGVVLLRLLARSNRSIPQALIFGSIGGFCIAAPFIHLVNVSGAYRRFDAPGREYTARVLNYEPTNGIRLPGSIWHPDGSFLDLYICLKEPDCNPEGTPFHDLGGDLYAVKIRSGDPLTSGPVKDLMTDQSADGESTAPGEIKTKMKQRPVAQPIKPPRRSRR